MSSVARRMSVVLFVTALSVPAPARGQTTGTTPLPKPPGLTAATEVKSAAMTNPDLIGVGSDR